MLYTPQYLRYHSDFLFQMEGELWYLRFHGVVTVGRCLFFKLVISVLCLAFELKSSVLQHNDVPHCHQASAF